MPILTTLLTLLTTASAAASAANVPMPAGPWAARFALPVDQKPEWSERGYLPAWQLKWEDAESPRLHIEGDENGHYRVHVFVGREFVLPERLP